MSKQKLARFVRGVQDSVIKHSPEILTGIGVAGMITTTILAVRATPKALQLIEEEKNRRNDEMWEELSEQNEEHNFEEIEKLSPVDVVKTTWKCYVPAAVTGVLSVTCVISALSVNTRRNAALATAYKLSETALSEYREKVIETVGEKKERTIREKVAQEKIDKNPISKSEIYITGKGQTLCMDAVSGRPFRSDIDTIKKVVNELNKRMLNNEMYISLNEFYNEVGLRSTKLGDQLGWNLHKEGLIELDFSATITEEGEPCIYVDYLVAPRYDFAKLM